MMNNQGKFLDKNHFVFSLLRVFLLVLMLLVSILITDVTLSIIKRLDETSG